MEFTVYKNDGSESAEKMVLENPAFNIEPHQHSVYMSVKAEMTNARQGTHCSKTRAEKRGGGKKPFPQKGRGAARAGSTRNPNWIGGGTAFGPKPIDYKMKVNKKVKKLARKSVLAAKYKENAIKVVENFNFEEAKAKIFRNFLLSLGIENKKITILTSELTENLYLASRNFSKVSLLESDKASTYNLLDCEILLVDKEGLEKLNNSLLAK